MISVTDLRSSTIFEDQGKIYQVLSYEHIKMGRGSANIKVKVKDLRSGTVLDKSFISGAKVKAVRLTKRDLQFLYKDSDNVYLMDPLTFEQISIPLLKLSGGEFLKEGKTFSLNFLEDEPLSLNIPAKMELKVLETGPSIRGNSATNIYKEAILENGLKTKVPLFIKVGDIIRIDTRTREYSQKA